MGHSKPCFLLHFNGKLHFSLWHSFRHIGVGTKKDAIALSLLKRRLVHVIIKHAIVKQLQGITFAAKSDSNTWVMMDGPENFDGSDGASRPKELLLMALGGCTASDVTSILKKKR